MKRLVRLVASLMVALLLTPPPGLFCAEVPAGTQIPVQILETVSPATASLGATVAIAAAADIKVAGQVVVRKGASGIAEVTRAEKKGAIGKPAIIVLEAKRIEAADGETLLIAGTKMVEGESKQTASIILGLLCLFPFLMKGGDAVVPSGTVINATLAASAEVN